VKTLALLCLFAVACEAAPCEDPAPPAGPALEQYHCATWLDEGVTFFYEASIWPDGSAFVLAEVGVNGSVGRNLVLTRIEGDRIEPVRVSAGGQRWTIAMERATYPVIELFIEGREYGFVAAGTCSGNFDPHEAIR
jgi:hypothetical protein